MCTCCPVKEHAISHTAIVAIFEKCQESWQHILAAHLRPLWHPNNMPSPIDVRAFYTEMMLA